LHFSMVLILWAIITVVLLTIAASIAP